MFESFNHENEKESRAEQAGFFGETNRETGEYHYRNGYTQSIYSDARYIPADDSTTPAHFYVPPQRSQPEHAESRMKKDSGLGKVLAAVAICLAFSVIGGVIGGGIIARKNSTRLSELETMVAQMQPAAQTKQGLSADDNIYEDRQNPVMTELSSSTVTPAQIYDLACAQVVGITTEVTYSNFFGQTSSSAVSGTGFIISRDGYIVTNHHVIEYAYKYGYTISAMLYDGSVYEAEIIGTDQDNDIAVLKIEASNLAPVMFGDSDSIHVGDMAYAVGNPLGELEFTMTSGTVSALNRLISSDTSDIPVNMFQIDAAVNSGNSGGPVYNSAGEVIGVVTAKYSSSGVEGIGFAIPAKDARRIAEDIIENGYVKGKAYLGIYYDESSNSIYNRYYRDLWNAPEGVLVLQVERGSCAEKAGLYDYDTIMAIDDQAVASGSDLLTILRNHSAGDVITITVYRAMDERMGSQILNLSVTLDEAVPKNKNAGMSAA